MKTTSKCQVTLPRHQREAVGIKPRQEVEMFVIEHGGRPVIGIAPKLKLSKGERMVARLRGTLKGQGTTDEILREVRGRE
jgi:bifunctional DNA-binding transcriptional regulator/antitoxin component of YhaV-PrlF toxin-antitoxin module